MTALLSTLHQAGVEAVAYGVGGLFGQGPVQVAQHDPEQHDPEQHVHLALADAEPVT